MVEQQGVGHLPTRTDALEERERKRERERERGREREREREFRLQLQAMDKRVSDGFF